MVIFLLRPTTPRVKKKTEITDDCVVSKTGGLQELWVEPVLLEAFVQEKLPFQFRDFHGPWGAGRCVTCFVSG